MKSDYDYLYLYNKADNTVQRDEEEERIRWRRKLDLEAQLFL